jgi:hypothetical protein
MTPEPVKRADLMTWKMVAGNEDTYNIVIDGDRLKQWVAIGWIDIGMATDEHRTLYPTIKDD